MTNDHVFQQNDYYCGPAVAAMVLKKFGIEATQESIAKELETGAAVGTSARELQDFFVKRGFIVASKNDAEWEDIIKALKIGAVIVGYIEPTGDPHYALIKDVEERKIILSDPYHGDNFVLDKEEFLKCWHDNEHNQYGTQMFMSVRKDQ